MCILMAQHLQRLGSVVTEAFSTGMNEMYLCKDDFRKSSAVTSHTKPREGSDVKCLTFELSHTFNRAPVIKIFCYCLKIRTLAHVLTECFAVHADDN